MDENNVVARRRVVTACVVGLGGLALMPGRVMAQAPDYPNKPIRMIVGFAAGATDTAARVLAEKLTQRLKVPVLVVNRPGANAMLAVQALKASAPDGYTVMFGTSGALAYAPALRKDLPYDVQTDFTPIVGIAKFHGVLLASGSVPITNVSELVSYAKQHPGELNYGSSGAGAAQHLSMQYLQSATGTQMTHIPFRGEGLIAPELLSGRITASFISVSAALASLQTGKVRALAVTSLQRLPVLPNVPTLREAGLPGLEGIDPFSWGGLVGPAGLPRAMVSRLNEAVNEALKDPEVVTKFGQFGFEPIGGAPAAFKQFVDGEINKWKTLGAKAHIEME